MGYDINSKHGGTGSRLDALSRKCRLDEDDEARAMGLYNGMIEAIADRVASRGQTPSPPPSVVYIAAYQHRFGVDLSAHDSRDNAEARLLSIAWQQCMRDSDIRAAVDARFGPLVSEQPPLEPPFEADLHSVEDAVCAAGDEAGRHLGLAPQDAATSGSSHGCPRDRGDVSVEERSRAERRRTFREQLLEEWPELSRGEFLWIAECIVEQDERSADHHDETDHDETDHGETDHDALDPDRGWSGGSSSPSAV